MTDGTWIAVLLELTAQGWKCKPGRVGGSWAAEGAHAPPLGWGLLSTADVFKPTWAWEGIYKADGVWRGGRVPGTGTGTACVEIWLEDDRALAWECFLSYSPALGYNLKRLYAPAPPQFLVVFFLVKNTGHGEALIRIFFPRYKWFSYLNECSSRSLRATSRATPDCRTFLRKR